MMTQPSEEKKQTPPEQETKTLPLAEYETLTAKVQELESLKDKLVRNAADFENAKKRLTKDREEFLKFAQENLLKEVLPILDNLERALIHNKEDETTLRNVVAGVERVVQQFEGMLKKQGLQRLKTVGEIFDPHFHEAVAYVEEEGKDHEILNEIEPGYVLHDRLLRVAKVRIRVAPPPPKPSSES